MSSSTPIDLSSPKRQVLLDITNQKGGRTCTKVTSSPQLSNSTAKCRIQKKPSTTFIHGPRLTNSTPRCRGFSTYSASVVAEGPELTYSTPRYRSQSSSSIPFEKNDSEDESNVVKVMNRRERTKIALQEDRRSDEEPRSILARLNDQHELPPENADECGEGLQEDKQNGNNSNQQHNKKDSDANHDSVAKGSTRLTPILRELAEIMACRNAYKRWDFAYIMSHASPSLQAYIKKRRSCHSVRINPMRTVVGDTHTTAFKKLREKLHLEFLLSSRRLKLDEDEQSLRSDQQVDSKRKDYDREAELEDEDNCDDTERGDGDSSTSSFASIDANDRTADLGLSPELQELAGLIESRPNNDFRVQWDWNHIDANASASLKAYLLLKKRQFPAYKKRPMCDIVGSKNKEAFMSYRASLSATTPSANKRKRDHSCSKSSRRTKQPDRGSPISDDDFEHSAIKTSGKQRRCRLRQEQVELATLLAKAKRRGRGWAYIERKSSDKLKAMIVARQTSNPLSYIAAPLASIIPASHQTIFEKYVSKAEENLSDDDEDHSDDEGSDRGSPKATKPPAVPDDKKDLRQLGQVFALERKARILALTGNIRAELRAFEHQELNLWNSFLM